MKRIAKIVLATAIVFSTAASAVAQNAFEDERYGKTLEERKTNLGKINFLRDAIAAKNWNEAVVYVRDLMNDAPRSSSNLYIWGTTAYTAKAKAATSLDQKKVYIDSVMLIYDRRAQYFGADPNRGTPYILAQKAQAYIGLNPLDGAGVRQMYREAVEASGSNAQPLLVLTYFQQMVNGYKAVELGPEELLSTYEKLSPLMENASQEDKDTFTGLFATSGAADCGVLEELYTKELAAKPGDTEILKKAFNLMTMAGCDTPFYISVAEQYYAVEPSSGVAARLATLFEKSEQYTKALQYLNERLGVETDPIEKANLYVRVAASELGLKRPSAAAQAARQVMALDPSNGYGYMLLGEAYINGSTGCSGFQQLTVYWLAYDALARAREAFAGNPGQQESISNRMNLCRANFPSKEDAFMYIEGYSEGASYSVNCGWISGSTSIRTR